MNYEVIKCANGWMVRKSTRPGDCYEPLAVHVFNVWAEVSEWLEKQFKKSTLDG